MNEVQSKIIKILKSKKKPLNRITLSKILGMYHNNRKAFNDDLNALISEGKVTEHKGRLAISRKQPVVEAEIVKVLEKFGFARPSAEDAKEDIFVPGSALNGAMPGDMVMVKIGSSRQRGLFDGEIVKITQEVNRPFVGVLARDNSGKYLVIPDQYVQFALSVSGKIPLGTKVGDKVLSQLKSRGSRHSEHRVQILESFGSSDSAAVCAQAILSEHGIVREFPEEVSEQARAIGSGAGIHPKELAMRVDLREWNIFTIDGADTKDIDDAISLDKTETGWELGVHIADVSYYVTRLSPLDKEAFNRGNSVYFANQVIPMLPTELSNGICSLNPNEDRLAFSAFIRLDKDGNIESYKFEKTVINSKVKGVYSEINHILEGNATPKITEKYQNQLDVVKNMQVLATILHKKRMARGAMNLESTESKIVVDEDGKAVDIIPRHSGISENIIEEFMLIANEAAAIFATKQELPFVYRVHEQPSADRAEKMFELLDKLGVKHSRPDKDGSYTTCFSDVLKEVSGTSVETIVNYNMLRSMAKAKYSPENLGHFGLALANYAHFTSPIRRYSDLAIHRILSGFLTGMRKQNIEKYFRTWTGECSLQTSRREMIAMQTERETEDCYKAEYMKNYIGEEYDGVVSSLTNFGIFIQLENTVEGLIRTEDFPAGLWQYDGVVSFNNSVGNSSIKIGDSIKITVVAADVASGKIDFAFSEPEKFV